MAVSDYKTVPDQNTTISGINIAEGCPPSGINNAIRQIMADIKAKADAQDTATSGKLPLAGGTITGEIKSNVSQVMQRVGDSTSLVFLGGDGQYASELALNGGSRNDSVSGCVVLKVKSASGVKSFVVNPDGTVNWDGRELKSFYFATFTSGNVSDTASNVTVSWTTPAGYTATTIRAWSNGWTAGASPSSGGQTGCNVYWNHKGSGTISVLVMFHR